MQVVSSYIKNIWQFLNLYSQTFYVCTYIIFKASFQFLFIIAFCLFLDQIIASDFHNDFIYFPSLKGDEIIFDPIYLLHLLVIFLKCHKCLEKRISGHTT